MSYLEKGELPYSLVLDPQTDRAVAYTSNHRLITALASAELVAFAKENCAHQQSWDEAKHDPTGPWRPMPDWVTPEVRARCVILWINRPVDNDPYWRTIPKA